MLSRIFNYIKNKKKLTRKFEENSEYILNGSYVIDNSLTYIYRNDELHNKKSIDMFGKNHFNLIKKIGVYIIKKIFFNKKINIDCDTKNEFSGSIYFMGVNRNDTVKLFDIKNNKVLTYYFIEDKYEEKINNYNVFEDKLPMPKIIESNTEKLMIIEEYIDFKSKEIWSSNDYDFIMDDIIRNYISYFGKVKDKDIIYGNGIELLNRFPYNNEVKNFILNNTNKKILNQKIPFIKLHGDLWSPNILLTKGENKKVFYIDLEYSDYCFIFYDIFWLLIEQAMLNKNYLYINKYFEGLYDKQIEKMFNIFGVKFHRTYKQDYLNLFFLNFHVNRIIKKNSPRNDIHFNEYTMLLKKLENKKLV